MKGFFDIDDRRFYLFPRFLLSFLRRYLRLEVEGLENVPQHGGAIILPNHSGWSGFDAVMLGYEIMRRTSRLPRILAHRLFFSLRELKPLSRKFGLREASVKTGLRLLRHNHVLLLFPEGEKGNFKPTAQRYRLQEFKTGFVKMAIMSRRPVIPTIVIGAEETHINLASVPLKKIIKAFPIPLNVFPLPAKWKIKFLEPIHLDQYELKDLEDQDLVKKIAQQVHKKMQTAINEELGKRKWIYFSPPPPQIENRPAA